MTRLLLLLLAPLLAVGVACLGEETDDGAPETVIPQPDGNGDEGATLPTPFEGGFPGLGEDCTGALPWDQAAEYAGQDRAVAGPIAGFREEEYLDEDYRVIALGVPEDERRGVDVYVPAERTGGLPEPLDQLYSEGQTLCAVGTISVGEDRLRIFVGTPDDLVVIPPGAQDPAAPGGECDVPFPWEQAAGQEGEMLPVAGPVVGYRKAATENDDLFIIEVGRPAPEEGGVDVAIPVYALENFGDDPQSLYEIGETICVDSFISVVDGRARVFAQLPEGIFVNPTADPATPADPAAP